MSSDSRSSPIPADPALEKLRRLPASATEDYQAFRSTGSEESLTRLIIAVLSDHAPDKASRVTEWKDGLSLIDDIGFDSLAIAESVFFFEDLFRISISNEEIVQVRTLGELRAFVKAKAATV